MNYSIHTIGLRKTFKNHIEYHRAEKELFSKAKGRFGVETLTLKEMSIMRSFFRARESG